MIGVDRMQSQTYVKYMPVHVMQEHKGRMIYWAALGKYVYGILDIGQEPFTLPIIVNNNKGINSVSLIFKPSVIRVVTIENHIPNIVPVTSSSFT